MAVAGMIGMAVMLSAGLAARRREVAILRSVGATPIRIFAVIVTAAAQLAAAGAAPGLVLPSITRLAADPVLMARFGVRLGVGVLSARELGTIAVMLCAGLGASRIPAIRVHRMTLADGLSVRLWISKLESSK